MPIQITSTTYSDEFNTGTTSNLDAVAGDAITVTTNLYYENIIDANINSQDVLIVGNGSVFGYSVPSKYSGNIIVVLNDTLQSSIGATNINELRGLEVTTVGFSTNYTGDVIRVISGVLTLGGNIGVGLVLDVAGTHSQESQQTGIVYASSGVFSSSVDFAYFGNANGSTFAPILPLDGGVNVSPNFSTLTNVLDASDTVTINTIPFKYDGAHQSGSLTIQGKGLTATSPHAFLSRQAFELVHVIDTKPVTVGMIGGITTSGVNAGSYFGASSQDTYKFSLDFLRNPSDTQGINILYRDTPKVSRLNVKVGGGSTKYSISNFNIIKTSDSEVSGVPIVTQQFTVTFDVDNTSASPFSDTNTKIKTGIEQIPNAFKNNENYEQGFLYDSALTTLGAGAISGDATGDAASITNYVTTFNSSSSISVSMDVLYTSGAQTQINNNQNPKFSIICTVQDHLLDYTNSDRVALSVFVGTGIQALLEDPATVNTTKFITAPFTDVFAGIDASAVDGFPVQLLVGGTSFSMDWTNRPNLRIDKISQNLVLKNTSTLEEIELEAEVIKVSDFNLIDGEYPDANYNVLKGFKIPETEVRNRITMVNVSDIASVRTFEITFPFFIRWEDYTELILNAVPSSILDSNEPFDGKNHDVHRIDVLADWELDYRIQIDSSESGVLFSQEFDYTLSTTPYGALTNVSSSVIDSYMVDGTTIYPTLPSGNKAIDSVENTWIKGEWTMFTTPTDIADFEIEFYLEGFENGSPTKIQRISSINGLLASSWFSDTGAGDGLVLKSIDGNKIVGECLVDVNRLAKFDSYRLYAQPYIPRKEQESLVTEDDNNLITESGDNIIIDF